MILMIVYSLISALILHEYIGYSMSDAPSTVDKQLLLVMVLIFFFGIYIETSVH